MAFRTIDHFQTRAFIMAALEKPDLVFRIGFAGNRNLPDEQRQAISDALAAVYEAVRAATERSRALRQAARSK